MGPREDCVQSALQQGEHCHYFLSRQFNPDTTVRVNCEPLLSVCVQSIAYGITFIKLHSPPDDNDAPITTPPVSAVPPQLVFSVPAV